MNSIKIFLFELSLRKSFPKIMKNGTLVYSQIYKINLFKVQKVYNMNII